MYSDGFCDSDPPIPKSQNIVICTKCNKEMWRDDINFREPDMGEQEELDNSLDVFDLPISRELNYSYNIADYYSGLIEKGFANTVDREIKLRIEIWHLLNNNYRYGNISAFRFLIKGMFRAAEIRFRERKERKELNRIAKKLFKDNLQKLICIFVPQDDDEKLFLAEMYRELGDFSNVKKVLKQIDKLNNSDTYQKIVRETKWRRSKVFNLN